MRCLSRCLTAASVRLAAAVLALGATGAPAAAATGPGSAQCGDYVSLYDGQLPAHDFVSWAQGYVAAANLAYGQHVEADGAALETWLVDYYRRHPTHRHATAVLEFVRAHVD